jgi:hypothetical protein
VGFSGWEDLDPLLWSSDEDWGSFFDVSGMIEVRCGEIIATRGVQGVAKNKRYRFSNTRVHLERCNVT